MPQLLSFAIKEISDSNAIEIKFKTDCSYSERDGNAAFSNVFNQIFKFFGGKKCFCLLHKNYGAYCFENFGADGTNSTLHFKPLNSNLGFPV